MKAYNDLNNGSRYEVIYANVTIAREPSYEHAQNFAESNGYNLDEVVIFDNVLNETL